MLCWYVRTMYTSIMFEDTNSTEPRPRQGRRKLFVGGTGFSTPLLLTYIVLTIDIGN